MINRNLIMKVKIVLKAFRIETTMGRLSTIIHDNFTTIVNMSFGKQNFL